MRAERSPFMREMLGCLRSVLMDYKKEEIETVIVDKQQLAEIIQA